MDILYFFSGFIHKVLPKVLESIFWVKENVLFQMRVLFIELINVVGHVKAQSIFTCQYV